LSRTETKLILQHSRIQILASVAHKVETSHQQHKVREKQPMPF
jgi:hypothetical protein